MINPTICSNSKMICRTLSLIANSTWLSDASAAVLTADTCEFCLGRHPFLRKIITTGERFSLSQNSCVFTQCSGDDNAPEHERSKEICHDYYIVDHVKNWPSTLNHCSSTPYFQSFKKVFLGILARFQSKLWGWMQMKHSRWEVISQIHRGCGTHLEQLIRI